MILRCLVVTVTRNRKGQPVRASKVVTGDPITIGRSAESSIYLADPRVHLHHGLIRNNDLGKLYVEGEDAAIDVNGELQSRAKLRRGARILIGPYQITPEPPTGPDHDFGLAVEMVQPLPEGLTDLRDRSRTLLSATWLPKRSLAWALFAAAGFSGLALPLAYATSPRFREEAANRLPERWKRVAWDAAWDPGPLSSGHQPLKERCDACHQVPFEPVQDRACVKCHTATGEHVRDASLRVGVNLGARCAECHRDHKGEHALVRTDSALCVNCHGDLKARYPKSTLATITDFASDHPALALSVANAATGEVERWTAERLASSSEASGLKFTHEEHLAKEGVRSPSGPRVLACSQCHKPDAANVRFKPVTMEENCSECHRLEFEPALMRRAPHGEPAEVLTTLREFYSRIALGERPIDVTLVNNLLRKPVADAGRVERKRALAWVEQKAQTVAIDLIETRLCVQCHGVSRVTREAAPAPGSDPGPEWTIQPVKITPDWLPGSTFEHKSHQQAACETCHDVRSSRSSADIAIPTLTTCRSCHTGTVAVKGKVRSPCETCHSFHQHPRPVSQAAVSAAAPSTTPSASNPR